MYIPLIARAAALATAITSPFHADRDASPSAVAEFQIVKRNIGGVEICTDQNWSGTCGYAVQPLKTCIVLTSPWYHSITSMGPDDGTVCQLFQNSQCSGTNIWIEYPGTGALQDYGWNDVIGSFECYSGHNWNGTNVIPAA
ncbi:hypothetical protein ACMFMG_000307 [Clarireedia jacksonii]